MKLLNCVVDVVVIGIGVGLGKENILIWSVVRSECGWAESDIEWIASSEGVTALDVKLGVGHQDDMREMGGSVLFGNRITGKQIEKWARWGCIGWGWRDWPKGLV